MQGIKDCQPRRHNDSTYKEQFNLSHMVPYHIKTYSSKTSSSSQLNIQKIIRFQICHTDRSFIKEKYFEHFERFFRRDRSPPPLHPPQV